MYAYQLVQLCIKLRERIAKDLVLQQFRLYIYIYIRIQGGGAGLQTTPVKGGAGGHLAGSPVNIGGGGLRC